MLTIREFISGPVIDNGECRIVQLPDGTAQPCDGLSDADRIWEEWEQGRGENDNQQGERDEH